MPSIPSLKTYYIRDDILFKVVSISSATDEVLLEDVSNGQIYSVKFSLFSYAYEKVLGVTQAAKLLGRHPRSIYRYEQREIINKPKCYPDKRGRMVRYYRKQDLLDIHELISEIHAGRPRKDKRVINNSLIPMGNFKRLIRERFK